MRKKVLLTISIISVLIVSAISFASCGEFNHLRPSGVYSTYEYTDEATGRIHRVLVQFIQEDLTEDKGVSGKVNFAHQVKIPNVDKWLTNKIQTGDTYDVKNPNIDTREWETSEYINITSSLGIFMSYDYDNNEKFDIAGPKQLFEIPLLNLEAMRNSKITKYSGYTLTKANETFPSAVDDFSPYNT